ncbi:MAG: ABC transporter permease [Candidatus Tritonobacter lacicola]|nr:ABC transporter permease [Candidatus Tritonobacter lacicola]
MRNVLTMFGRELRSYFYSPIAYIVLTVFTLINGYTFWLIVAALNNPRFPVEGSPMQFFFGGTIFFYLTLSLIASVVTMRLLAEEKKSGTIEVLMTAPVRDTEVIAAKYLSALAFYAILWLPTLAYVAILKTQSSPDLGPVASGYLGSLLLGAMFLSIGAFASTLTKNQIVSAVFTFIVLTMIWTVGFLDGIFEDPAWKALISYVNVFRHFDNFGKGIVDTRALVYYLSTALFFLFLAVKVIDSRKWR